MKAYREAAVAIADKKLKEVDDALARENPIKGLGRRLSSGSDLCFITFCELFTK